MFENKEKTPLDQIGEFPLIDHLTKDLTPKQASTVLGIGDDAAAIRSEGITVTSTDLLVENVHFDMVYTPLRHLGYKAISVNVSDLCAMNAEATHAMVSIALSSKYTLEAVEELYAGMKLACERFGVDLVGGDTSTAHTGMVISVTVLGKVDKEEDLILRSGAKEGELICVSGDLGGAYAGLQLLEREKRIFMEQPEMQPDLEGKDYIVARQLRPEARVDMRQHFADLGVKPTAMIDISDGLASDLMHLCKASGIGAKLYEDKIPIDPLTYGTARELNMDPTIFALNGGEDYELLFTLPQSDYDKIKHSLDITVIGYCVAAHEKTSLISKTGNEHELKAQGWTAFGQE